MNSPLPAFVRSPIVTRQAPEGTDAEGDFFDAGFSRPRGLFLKTSSPDASLRLLRGLGYRVRREPRNLRAHVQHIHALHRAFCAAEVSEQRLFSGIAALFAVLGTRGAALQKRLLDRVIPHLSEERIAALRSVPHEATLPPERASELTLVAPVTHALAEEQDPVSYADELLCAGDYEEATAVLERALPRMADNPALAEALQAIYRSARTPDAYAQSRATALEKCPDAAAWWPPIDTFFRGR